MMKPITTYQLIGAVSVERIVVTEAKVQHVSAAMANFRNRLRAIRRRMILEKGALR